MNNFFSSLSSGKVLVFFLIFIMAGLNLFTLWTLKANASTQLLFWILGLTVFFFLIFWRPSLSSWRKFDWLIYLSIVISLLLPLFWGQTIRGARRWLHLGIFSIQVSEIVKPFFILSFVSLIERGKKWTVGFLVLLPLPVIFLLLKEPDFGSAILYLSLVFFLALLYYWRQRKFWVALGGGVLLFFLLLPYLLSPYQKQRWNTFLHPGSDPLGAGYNTLQAKVNIGSGRILGHGLWHLKQELQFLPEAHTDFIFASWAHATGFAGVIFILSLYTILFWTLGQKVLATKTEWVFIFRFLLLAQLWLQTLVNLGMNLGILPVTGLPLPFFSYGGSSLLASILALAFILL